MNRVWYAIKTMTLKDWAIVAIVVLINLLIWLGYGHAVNTVTVCNASVTKYVTAEFSETSYYSCTDSNGYISMCSDTDYWSEPVSRRYQATTINGKQTGQNYQGDVNTIQYGVVYPPMPSYDTSAKGQLYFDNFRNHTDTLLVIGLQDIKTKEVDSVRDPISKNVKCVDAVGKHVFAKTWYGITYSAGL